MALPVLNAFLDDGGDDIVLLEQLPDGSARERRVPAPYTSYHRSSDITPKLYRQLKGSPAVRSVVREGETWIRIAWRDENVRRQSRYKLKDIGIESFEGDVDPVMYHLVASKAEIAKPRRCSLDLETDSRVPLSRKEEMRILTWAVTDFETGQSKRGILREDTDRAEEQLLEELVAALKDFDQVVIWEGDWDGGEFDTFVFEARSRKRGLGVDPRRWMWLNQLAVWRRMNQHSAESGAEKESMKLEDIAFEQLGEGKQKAPAWVIERFGDRAKKSLGALAWDLWEAGGEFRQLLSDYNVRDAELLRELELKKGFITLFQALAGVCGIPPVTRSLQPTRQMDGFLLRLGREHDHRFPTKAYRDEDPEEEKGKFKGAVVFKPKSVPHDADPKLGIEEWTKEQAREWRRANGFKNGILSNINVCDFASLYPSVMRTWNLDGASIVGWRTASEHKKLGLEPGTCRSPGTNLVTRLEPMGYLPLAFETLIRLRKEFSDLAASLPPGSPEWNDAMAKSTAYKVAANSFYGGGASKFSRFNNRDASEACTQNGVHFLKITAAEAERRRMIVVYGDTDSVFTCGSTVDGYRSFVNWLNTKRFPAEVAAHGCKTNHIKLAFEKTFERIVFVSAKAYVGRYSQYKGTPADRECHGLFRGFKKGAFVWRDDEDPERAKPVATGEHCPECGGIGKLAGAPEIKGVAWKRGDKGKLARELQGKVIDLLVGGVKIRDASGRKIPINPGIETPTEDLAIYTSIIEAARNHVLAEELPLEEVRMSRGLNKSVKAYGESTDAHVRIARVLEARGEKVGEGSRVEYVVVDGSKSPQEVIPAEDYNGECDRYYLWERVYQPSKILLEAAFPDEDWESWGDVRPAKPRGRAAKVPDTQLGLSLAKPAPPRKMGEAEELAVPAFSSRPLSVEVPEEAGQEALTRLAAAFAAHPGARPVEIVILLTSGSRAVVRSSARVSTGPRLKAAVALAIAGGESSAP